ncbi:uncharacterized protein LOC122854092 [Aphidius gifuensis]|uniref:uncharacterized protein LOC122854092 n=1 Tax=Aphidius gifuensis TaxID=684658 RepID=UPI001CDCF103|nr:uncharacterized protein LOC122854092 [Aphidius gifuensis]
MLHCIEFLSVIFRHGDRTPDVGGYPNDPYKNFDFAPEGRGQLTNTGKMREYRLGEKIRELYGDFIGDTYSPSIVNARSTDFDRTKMSLQLVLAALFKPNDKQIWNENLNWQPTIVDFVPGYLDVLMVPQQCPQYLKELSRVNNLPEIQARLNKLSGLMKNLTKWTGKSIETSADIFFLYITLSIEDSLNLTLPEWTKGIYPNGLLLNGTILHYETISYTTKLKRLNGGMLLQNITENMLDVISNKTEFKNKMYLYSGHEENVAAFLITLGVYDRQVPQFSSAVFLELLSDSGEYYVQVRHYKGIPEETITLKIPGCDELCPFKKFLKLMEPVTPEGDELKYYFVFLRNLTINAEPTIKLLNIVFRHGDRTPDDDGYEGYPNDPYGNFDFAPEGRGQLMNPGKMRAYRLGEKIRELYGDFIGNTYSPSIVNARSTDADRTKMSLQLVLAALFKPSDKQIWNGNLNWQPTIVSFVPEFFDALMLPQDCPNYLEEFSRVKKSPEVQKELNELSGFMKNLSEWTGKPIRDSFDMFNIYHTLMGEYASNLTLPDWTQGIFPYGLLWNGIILEYETVSYNRKLKRLNGGMLLKNITESMIDKMRNINLKKKINLFGGHEFNIAALLNTMEIYEPHVPEYSSAIFFELLADNQDHYVKVRYYKGIPEETITMKIPGCEELCPFENFLKLMEPVTPEGDELMCEKQSSCLLSKKIHDKFYGR